MKDMKSVKLMKKSTFLGKNRWPEIVATASALGDRQAATALPPKEVFFMSFMPFMTFMS